MPRRWFARLAGVVVGVVLLAAAGCAAGAGGSAGATPTDSRKKITIGFSAEPANLDFTRTDGAAIPEALLVNVYEGLVELNQQTGEIEPALAESWTVSPDGLVYDFTLRDGVTFSNGAPFTADDVKFSIERVKSDAWTVSLKSGMSVVSGVEVVSPTHARVTLSQPSNSWLFRMTTRIGAMFDASGVGDLANTPVGTGPYTVSEFRRGDRLVLTRRSGRSTCSTSRTQPRPSTRSSPTAST
jgi:peptide/nickel transport system substrate-binding protein